MRLLNIKTLKFTIFNNDNRPKYVVASHRWVEGSEVTYQDVLSNTNLDKSGYQKILDFAKYAEEHVRSVEWLWVDTCCINKDSAAELSEAINLMFEWYRGAEVCIAYLSDVEAADDKDKFGKSEWFRRGWTLQELLAPRLVVFVTRHWKVIGNKGASTHGSYGTYTGNALEANIANITGIPEHALHDFSSCYLLSTAEKLKWMEGRATTREEDMSYALCGILGVALGANYGERFEGAKQRLLAAIHYDDDRKTAQAKHYNEIVKWLSPPDPWTNHHSARHLYEAHTGSWLVSSQEYQDWKAASIRHLWMYGKAGCGKTVLCSTVIEDIKEHCRTRADSEYAIFYFTFSDQQKQRRADMLLSLIAQLGSKEPAFSLLQQAYDRPNRIVPGFDELKEIFMTCLEGYDEVFLLLDAIDECPEDRDNRHDMMTYLTSLSQKSRRVKIFATSRELMDFHQSMVTLGAKKMSIATDSVDIDIRQYIATQLRQNTRLSRLDQTSKALIEDTLSAKSDGMFRWAFCQLQELKKLKSTKASYVKKALFSLPSTLDETYERILSAIEVDLQADALTLLRWLAYAREPPTLGQLADASVIDLTGEGTVHWEDRPELEDPLEILAGLVTIIAAENSEGEDDGQSGSILMKYFPPDESNAANTRAKSIQDLEDAEFEGPNELNDNNIEQMSRRLQISEDTRVRLAHFSVKEYLEAERILKTNTKGFYLDSRREHGILTQSCLKYLMRYSDSDKRSSSEDDLTTFPLLEYAAGTWYYHAKHHHHSEVEPVESFLCSRKYLYDWLLVCHRSDLNRRTFEPVEDPGSAIYYASLLGLDAVVRTLLEAGPGTNAQGYSMYNALRTAPYEGHEYLVEWLLGDGAEVNANAQRGPYSPAPQAASCQGHKDVVQMPLNARADTNAHGDHYGKVQRATCPSNGSEQVVAHVLLDLRDVNAHGGFYGNALQAASRRGHDTIVQMLLVAGADINARGGVYSNALLAASHGGHSAIVEMLLVAGADVNARGYKFGSALQVACNQGNTAIVQMLLDAGADVNAWSPVYSTALHAAVKGYGKIDTIVHLLLDAGADIHAKGGHRTPLEEASHRGNVRGVQLLLAARGEKDVHTYRKEYNYALCQAHRKGHGKIVQMLLDVGAELIGEDGAPIVEPLGWGKDDWR